MKSVRIYYFILIIFSLSVGTYVFSVNEFRESTLNIDATSMEKAVGTVFFEGTGYSAGSHREFEINEYDGDEGMKKLYVIELPATRLHTLRIDPRVRSGAFGIDRIILANDVISYTWNEQGVCTQQLQTYGFHTVEACPAGGPVISAGERSSIVITAIPETGFLNTPGSRIARSATFAIGTLCSGLWLLWPLGKRGEADFRRHFAVRSAWLAVAAAFVYQLYLVCRYSVDVPMLDDWMYFKSDGLINGLTWQWLLRFHSEHPFALSKLMAWLNLKLFGLNFTFQNIFKLVIFGGLLAVVAQFKNIVLGKEKFVLFPFFMIFLLSPINWENHLWALQTTYHLVVMCSILTLFYTYNRELTFNTALKLSACAVMTMYVYSAGVIYVGVYLLFTAAYICAGIVRHKIDRTSGLKFLLIVFAVYGVNLCLWSIGYEDTAWPHPKVFPNDVKFWDFFLNIVSLGFGFKKVHILPGIVCLLLVLYPPIRLLIDKETRWRPSTWLVLTAVSGSLAVLAAVTLGRAWVYPSKTSRYVEFGFLLVPYSALGWWLVTKEGPRRVVMLSLLWVFCFVSYFNDWGSSGYALCKQFRLYDLTYAESYYSGAVNGILPDSSELSDFDRAKKLGVNFARQFTSGSAGRK